MTYLDLTLLKQHLNIEPDFTDDDEYISFLEEAAGQAVEKYIDFPLEKLVDEDTQKLPQAVIHAILLLVGTWYNQRESVGASVMPIPNAFELLCDLFRDYRIDKE